MIDMKDGGTCTIKSYRDVFPNSLSTSSVIAAVLGGYA